MMNLIVQNSRLIKRMTLVLSALIVLLLGFYIVHLERKFDDVSQVLRERLEVVEDVQSSLAKLNADIGYGGFIHNFKNYVLRRDEVYRLNLLKNYENALTDLSILRKQLSAPIELQALDAIEAVLGSYKEKLTDLPRVRTLSQLAKDDAQVKVDDAPA
jgi:methyl-accepting chemotaxis protein